MFEKHSKRRNDLDFVTDENENEERCRDCVDSSGPISVTFLFFVFVFVLKFCNGPKVLICVAILAP